MNTAAELERNPVSISTRFSLSMEMSRLTRDGTAETVSRDQILRHERGQGYTHFPCAADHEQDWQPYPVDPFFSCYMCDHTYIHTCVQIILRTVSILQYTILHYTLLYSIILYYTIVYYTILHYTTLYYIIPYYTILYYTILHYTILYYTKLLYTILYYTILYYTTLN